MLSKNNLNFENLEQLVASIVTWNSEQTIANCIKSVLAQSYKDFLLVIVDNNSDDKTCDVIEQFDDPRLRLRKNKENTGFCGGHNFVISNTRSELVLLVNPDIIMKPDYMQKAIDAIISDPKIGTVGGLLLQSDLDSPDCTIDSTGMELKRSGVMRLINHGKKLSDVKLKTSYVFGVDGALPIYRRSMIKDISYQGEFFDEMFFAHKEDWDVSWRAHLYGWKTVFDPSCVAIHPRHFKPKSLKVRTNINKHIKMHAVKNQLILLLKNKSLPSFWIDGIFIVSRQSLILLYVLLFERSSLKAYRFVFRNFKLIMAKRQVIQNRRVNK